MENNLNKQRILVNKYTDNPLEIISDAFYSGYGEVILSIKKGEEGIYVKNDAGEITKLGVDQSVIESIVKNAIENEIDNIAGERLETLVKEGIASEEARAIKAEEALQTLINSESAKAQAANIKLEASINDEIKRATGVEELLTNSLEELSVAVEDLTTNIEDTVQEIITDKLIDAGVPIHQDISESQYKELIEKGQVVVVNNKTGKKETIKYSDEVYYMIFDDIEQPNINDDNIILENNWTPYEPIVIESGNKNINLNTNKIIGPDFIDESDNSTNSYGLWAKGGEVTIDGEGEVVAQDADYSMAVWANGGTVRINGGTFRNGGDSCDLIYASNGGRVEIYGGEFIANGPASGTAPGTKNPYVALNVKDRDRETSSIEVFGGRFFKFNPADNLSEGEHTNFVAEGYKSIQDGDYWVVVKNEE